MHILRRDIYWKRSFSAIPGSVILIAGTPVVVRSESEESFWVSSEWLPDNSHILRSDLAIYGVRCTKLDVLDSDTPREALIKELCTHVRIEQASAILQLHMLYSKDRKAFRAALEQHYHEFYRGTLWLNEN